MLHIVLKLHSCLHVWDIITTIKLDNRTLDKRDMDTRMVVSVSDSNNNWNGSDEKREDRHIKDSIRLDRLSLEQGKITDTRGSITSLDFVI